MRFKHVLGRKYLLSTRKTAVLCMTARTFDDLMMLERLAARGVTITPTDL